jgi:hypothetical protein
MPAPNLYSSIDRFNSLMMIVRTDGRFSVCSFCSVSLKVLHDVSRKIPTLSGW